MARRGLRGNRPVAPTQWVAQYLNAAVAWYWRRAVLPSLVLLVLTVIVLWLALPYAYSALNKALPQSDPLGRYNYQPSTVVYGKDYNYQPLAHPPRKTKSGKGTGK